MNKPTVKVTGPGDMVVMAPHLLGFTPHESLLLVGLRESKVLVSARFDLPEPQELVAATESAFAKMLAAGVEGFIVLVFSGDPERFETAQLMRHVAETREVHLVDSLFVHGGRWRSAACTNPECCPPEGTPVPALHDEAELVLAGSAPLADRSGLTAMLEPTDEVQAEPEHLLPEVTDTKEEKLAWWRWAVEAQPSKVEQLRGLAVALRSTPVRDALIGELATLGPADLRAWISLLGNVSRATNDPADANVAAVLACVGLFVGNGALVNVAVKRALACDPEHRLAQLAQHVADAMVDPAGARAALAGAA